MSRGIIFTINNFNGPIEIFNSTFNKNMVFFPSAAFSNSPKYNTSVLDFDLTYFLNKEFKGAYKDAYIEMQDIEQKNWLNHTVQFWNYLNYDKVQDMLAENYTS